MISMLISGRKRYFFIHDRPRVNLFYNHHFFFLLEINMISWYYLCLMVKNYVYIEDVSTTDKQHEISSKHIYIYLLVRFHFSFKGLYMYTLFGMCLILTLTK